VNHYIARPVSLTLASLIGLISALVALTAFSGAPAGASTRASTPPVSQAQLAFRNDMRKLWEDHIVWTRMAIISLTSDAADTDASVGRLLQNQTDIGNAVKPFYGKAAGQKLTALLREHIVIAVDVLKAAKSGNKAATNRALARWNANADVISAFLSKANPKHWPEAAVRSMMREHLALTTNEAVARLQGRWAADVKAADAVERAMLHMADTLSSGIVAQFPARFR
jgi:hypothetical protein